VAGPPLSSIICHCTTCRRASGAPTVAWLTVNRAQFEILSGSPIAFQSSRGVTRRFCGACGSALSYENADSPTTIDVTTLSLDDPNRFPPTAEVWLQDKVSWQVIDGSVRQYPQGASSG
jgi:hypothetical protein